MSPKEFKNEMIRLRDETCGYKHYGYAHGENFKGSRLWRRCRRFCQDR